MAHPYPDLPLPAGPHRRGSSGNERFGLLRTAPVLPRRVGLPVRGTVTLIDTRFAHISGDEKNVRFSNRQLRPTFIPPLTSEDSSIRVLRVFRGCLTVPVKNQSLHFTSLTLPLRSTAISLAWEGTAEEVVCPPGQRIWMWVGGFGVPST